MAKRYSGPILPPDPVFSFLEKFFKKENPDPQAVRFSQYHTDHLGHLSAIFVHTIENNTIIYRVRQNCAPSHGVEYGISSQQFGELRNIHQRTTHPDPDPYSVANDLLSVFLMTVQSINLR